MRVIADAELDRVSALVGRGRIVVLVEQTDPRLAVRLSAAGCRVVALGVEQRYIGRFAPFCERVQTDMTDDGDAHALAGAFDAALVSVDVGDVQTLSRLAARARPLLQSEGTLLLLTQQVLHVAAGDRPFVSVARAVRAAPGDLADDRRAAREALSGRYWSLDLIVESLRAGGFIVSAVEWLPPRTGTARPTSVTSAGREVLDVVIGAFAVDGAPSPVERIVSRLACEAADVRLALHRQPAGIAACQASRAPETPAVKNESAPESSGETTAVDDYPNMVRRVRELILRLVPSRSTVLVVTRGDDEFLRLGSRVGWHFPRAQSGEYAGFYPSTSLDAIDHVEELRSMGAHYLVFPQPAAWWLEHYAGLTRHLNASYPRLHAATDAIVYQLFNSGVSDDA